MTGVKLKERTLVVLTEKSGELISFGSGTPLLLVSMNQL